MEEGSSVTLQTDSIYNLLSPKSSEVQNETVLTVNQRQLQAAALIYKQVISRKQLKVLKPEKTSIVARDHVLVEELDADSEKVSKDREDSVTRVKTNTA